MPRPLLSCLLLPLTLAACGQQAPAAPDVSALKAQLREELRAEVEAELRRELAGRGAPLPAVKPALSEGELRAIAAAKHPGAGEGDGDGPIITHVPTAKDAAPAGLTEADRRAAADDPAAGKLPPAPDTGPAPRPRAATLPEPPPAPAPRPTPPTPPAATIAAAEAPDLPTPSGGRELRPGVLAFPGAGAMRLADLAIATGVDGRAPAGVADRFPTPPERLVCYTALENRGPEAAVIHVWRRGTRVLSRVELRVGKSPSWRTWSRQRVRPELFGEWSCEILDPDGGRLGLARFQVGPH